MRKARRNYILIVDDSPAQQRLIKDALESEGYTAECTSNGAEALDFLRARKEKPQTILVDLYMPVMGGLEFRRLQRRDPELKDIPVVIMGGKSEILEVDPGSDILKKPLTIEALMRALKRNAKFH